MRQAKIDAEQALLRLYLVKEFIGQRQNNNMIMQKNAEYDRIVGIIEIMLEPQTSSILTQNRL